MALNNFDDDDQFKSSMNLFGEPEPEQPSDGGSSSGLPPFPDSDQEPEPEPEKKPSGKNFLIAIGILGAIMVLALVLLVLIAPRIISQQQANQMEQVARINAANTATALAATQQFLESQATATPQPTAVQPTKTPVVVIATSTPHGGAQSTLSPNELATVHALQTKMAAGGTITPGPTSTKLPNTGFADDFGLPGVFGLAAVLVAVIFISRKIRTASH